MVATKSDSVISRAIAISFKPFQNASSRLTLVLWPAMTIERLITGDFIGRLPARCDGRRDGVRLFHPMYPRACGWTWVGHGRRGWHWRARSLASAWLACG